MNNFSGEKKASNLEMMVAAMRKYAVSLRFTVRWMGVQIYERVLVKLEKCTSSCLP